MTTDVRREARERVERALTSLRRTEMLAHRYGRASMADVHARRAEYEEARDALVEAMSNEGDG